MDHSAEASMEEILASIRRIIAAEPKVVKAFADEHFQKFSDAMEQFPSQASIKQEASFGGDFSDKNISQDHAQKVEPSFSSLSAPSLNSRKNSTNLNSRPTAPRFVQALDEDLAGLIESPMPPRHETKKDALVKDTISEKLSNDVSFSNYSDGLSKGFIPSQNIQSAGRDPQVENESSSSSIEEGSSKKEPSFYSSLTSNDFLKKEDFLSSSQTSSSVFAIRPKDLLETANKTPSSFVEEVLSQPVLAKDEPLPDAGVIAPPSDQAEKQETESFIKFTAESSPINLEMFQKDEAIASAQLQSVEAKEENLQASSPQAPQRSFEDVVTDMLRPMLEKWIEKNLPHLLPKLLKTDNS